MKTRAASSREVGIALILVLLNFLVVVQIVGVAYEPAAWMAFAQEYTGVTDSLILHPR